MNLFSGGALLKLSVFALGIMPYITASIIVQLLRVVIPRFEELHKEGQSGTAKLTQYTRYLTIGLAILQSTTIITVARSGQLFSSCTVDVIPNDSWYVLLIMVITMTAGTGLIMWLGELITERGVGNGMSLLIFTSIAASFPTALWSIARRRQRRLQVHHRDGRHRAGRRHGRVRRAVAAPHPGAVRQAHGRSAHVRRLQHVHPDQDQHGRRHPDHLRVVAARRPRAARPVRRPDGRLGAVDLSGTWRRPSAPLHLALYVFLIIFFCYFYTAITFNPDEVADNMKKYGGFIPGIRAGRPTAEYLDFVISRITAPGSIYLAVVALIPTIVFIVLGVGTNIPFGGSSILIVVGVGLETVKQIESQLQQRHYEGFLR